MPSLREQFHELSNWHNKITIASGVLRDVLDEVSLEDVPLEAREAIGRAQEAFRLMESYALGADGVADTIKKTVYGRMDPDNGRQKEA
jgi:hypothetical protein